MTELHYALIAAAVVLLLLLLAWSKWQERRQVRRLREGLGAPEHDPLQVPAGDAAVAGGGRIEPHLGNLPAEAGAPAAQQHPRPQLPEWIEDPLLDCVLELRCAHAVDGVAVIDATAALLRLDCGLPVHVVAWDARAEQWVVPDRFGFYSELLASIQLANRSRRLGDIEASQFIAAVQQVAVALDVSLSSLSDIWMLPMDGGLSVNSADCLWPVAIHVTFCAKSLCQSRSCRGVGTGSAGEASS